MFLIVCLLAASHVDVRVNGAGPFRFTVDTGAETSIIDPEVAIRAGVAPTTRVEVVTAGGVGMAAAARVSLSAGVSAIEGIEVLVRRAESAAGSDGVLGQSFLSKVSYRLEGGRLRFEDRAPDGYRVPIEWIHGRPAIQSSDGRRFVIDSGASHPVLFGKVGGRPAGFASLVTNEGRIRVAMVEVENLSFGGIVLRRLLAAHAASGGGGEDGLIPARLFRAIHIDSSANVAVLVP